MGFSIMDGRQRRRLGAGLGLAAMVLVMSGGTIPAAWAQSEPDTPKPSLSVPAADPVLEIARAAAEGQIGRPVTLQVDHMREQDGWAFVLSQMRGPDGALLDYTGTYLEQAAREGGASHVFCALLRRDAESWTVVATCLGAMDLAWDGWDREHGAPSELFRLQ